MVLLVLSLSTSMASTTNLIKITMNSSPQNQKHNAPNNTTFPSSTLRSLSKSGKLEEALRLVESSPSLPTPNKTTIEAYTSLLHACISQKSLQHGQRLYLHFLLCKGSSNRNNLLDVPTLKAKLITLFSVCGRVDEARQVFYDAGTASQPVIVLAMAIGYLKNGYPYEALLVYSEMLGRSSVQPSSNFAFSMAIKACTELGDLRLGKAVHAQIVKSSDVADQVLHNALLRFYSECGNVDGAVRVFDKMPDRNVVSWNSLIASFLSHDKMLEAMDTFRTMQGQRIGFSWVTLTTILPACARLTALLIGKEVHGQILKSTKEPDALVLNSLMDMYAKCGEWELCRRVFDRMKSKDLASWNTMLTCYALNGRMTEAMELFDSMIVSGITPDGVTFIALLSGCSHVGLTNDGLKLFERMRLDFGLSPTLEHYACLVDILGRAGRIREALEVAETMPMEPSGSIWGSLLNSCRLHGNVSIGELAATRLFKLEPENPGNYVILSNIYANAGMWKQVEMVREMMELRCIRKEAGCSWIQVKDRLHTFVAGGSLNLRNSSEYRELWTELEKLMEEAGYVPDASAVLHNIDDDMKSMWICGHSERLAAMFGLLHTSSAMPIRIIKNLRVCVDCHSWMKIISKATGRVVILRDTKRFHHFSSGLCSCNDYW
ncbi:hypothetical protein Ancab_029389 [Ancistrocladus abbreviatus]